jgi:hypothetical protein
MIRTLCSLAAVLLWSTACGGSEEATGGGYSALCNTIEDCADGLECANGVCTGGPCTSNTECGEFSDKSICYNRCFDACSDTGTCQRLNGSLKCILHEATLGTCRVF